MTAIVSATGYPKKAIIGDLKLMVIKTDANAATGHTYDTNFDSAGGDFFVDIIGTFLQNETGTDVASPTYSATTGIITLPTISTGVHKLTIWGV